MSGHTKEKTRDEIDMKLLRELAALPPNKYCFDCGQRGPTYVNVTIGSFVCSSCGGLLRGLNPPHRVKSLTVCSFTEVEMDRIKSRGNEYCTHIWLGKHESKTDSPDLSNPEKRKEFMILKYEEKKFYVDPREAIKKMKPRAPPAPSASGVNSSVPRSQTVMTHKQSIQIQRPAVMSQAFSAGDISSNVAHSAVTAFDKDPFREIKKSENGGDASFADFDSAFSDTGNKESPSIQLPVTSVTSSNSHKKPAPPPPDRYAALADLDNQLHQQTAAVPPAAPANNSAPFWSAVAPSVPTAAVFASSVPNPFQSPWPQTVPCTQNPFQLAAQPVASRNVVLPQQSTSGMPAKVGLPNGNIGATVYWPTVSNPAWGGRQFQSNPQDPFANSGAAAAIDSYNPWSQSFGTSSANPFEKEASVLQSSSGNAKNPFL